VTYIFPSIVGDADGGKMFTPKEYEAYKNKMLKTSKNRVYTLWLNANGKYYLLII